MRINLLLCLSLAACDAEARPGVSRVWPELGTMMSAAAWGTDSTRVARTLDAARDSVDHIDSLLQRHVSIAALDAVRREILRRTGIALVADSIAPGYALDRAALALANVVDSALLDLGGQYLWVGPHAPPARPTHRAVGIPDPDNTLRTLAVVDLQGGSVRTASQRNAPRGAARSVTVLAGDGLTASAWAAALLALGCDRALAVAQGMHVICADSTGVRWATGLQNRVSLPPARGP
ncbi:MAG TPA: FAD:protein FMN transferase [Gemmatimonadales bacterium]